jgi:transcription antitermination factor NusG
MHQGPWHVLHVVANHEKQVARHLSIRSVEHYVPLYTERSRWTDRTVILERPLFLGYVFVHLTPQNRLPLISTPGVIRLLGNSDSGIVTSEEISRIREGLESGCILRPHPNVRVGTPVRVREGAFAGVEGIVTQLRQHCRVIISLAAVQQSFSLEADLGDLEVLGNSISNANYSFDRVSAFVHA